MKHTDGFEIISAKDRKAWRAWLQKNWDKKQNTWLRIYKKPSSTKSVKYEDAVEEALCFGWIDSKPNKYDDESYLQFFAKRKPKSLWSMINRERVERMIAQGLMLEPGLEMIKLAKKTGTWEALEDVHALVIPKDLQEEFAKHKTAAENFNAFSPSSKRGILEWILNAKRKETREKRIVEAASLAAKGLKANQYNPS